MGSPMILKDLLLPSRINQRWQYSGIDSPEKCNDKKHFHAYPYAVEYAYNSRGFRDDEWPQTMPDLQSAIWCVGDSFTAGIGQPLEHIWPKVLSECTGRRIINVSMDGASNRWMKRNIQNILDHVKPELLIVMWSYIHRREDPDTAKSDEDRRIYRDKDASFWEDVQEFYHCLLTVCGASTSTTVKHFMIPDAFPAFFDAPGVWHHIRGPTWPENMPDDLDDLPEAIKHEIQHDFKLWDELLVYHKQCKLLHDVKGLMRCAQVTSVPRLDLARDGHHFDIVTSRWIADQVCRWLSP